MKRSAIDVLRRGFENALANWPLVLLRIAEAVVMAMIVIGAVIAAVIPVVVSAGLNKFDIGNPQNVAEFFASLVLEHWMLLGYLFGLAFVILGVLIAVHSFVEAGSAQIYVDGERVAGSRAFAIDRWLGGGRKGWWAVFWIYNFAWSVGGLIILIPAIFTILFMLIVSEAGARVAIGCVGLALMVVLMMPVAVLVGMWTQKAIAVCVARSLGAADALRAARREIKLDFGRHFLVMLLLIVIGFIAGGIISGVSFPFSFAGGSSHRGASLLPLFFAPVQIVLSLLQTAASAAMGAWSLASFVALTEER